MLLGLNNIKCSLISVYLGKFYSFVVCFCPLINFAWLLYILTAGDKCAFTVFMHPFTQHWIWYIPTGAWNLAHGIFYTWGPSSVPVSACLPICLCSWPIRHSLEHLQKIIGIFFQFQVTFFHSLAGRATYTWEQLTYWWFFPLYDTFFHCCNKLQKIRYIIDYYITTWNITPPLHANNDKLFFM